MLTPMPKWRRPCLHTLRVCFLTLLILVHSFWQRGSRGSQCTRRCSQKWCVRAMVCNHLPLALIVSDFVSQTFMRLYTRHWSEHPLIGQFHLDGDVNLAAAIVLFVHPEHFVELPPEVTLCQGGRLAPDMCPQLQRFWHRSTKRIVCWRLIIVLPCELQQSPHELFPCLFRCGKNRDTCSGPHPRCRCRTNADLRREHRPSKEHCATTAMLATTQTSEEALCKEEVQSPTELHRMRLVVIRCVGGVGERRGEGE